MSSLHDTLSEIVASASVEHVDAVTLVKDYFDEKGSHLSRERVAAILKAHGLYPAEARARARQPGSVYHAAGDVQYHAAQDV